MIEKLKKILETKNLYGYKILNTHTYRYELYFVKQELDMNRYVDVNEYEITIYKVLLSKLGYATTIVDSSMSDEELMTEIDELVNKCCYALNPIFELPKKVNFKNVIRTPQFQKQTLKEAAFMIADAIFESDKYDHGYMNSCEIFVNFKQHNLYTSAGIEYQYSQHFADIELITSWIDRQDVELYKFLSLDSFDFTTLNSVINKMFLDAKNRANALPMVEMKNTKVMFTESAVKDFFLFFAEKCAAKNIYHHLSNYAVGATLTNQPIKGDMFTLQALEKLDGSTKNIPFDKDGIVLKNKILISNNYVKSLWGDNIHAQYLHLDPTGNYDNFKVDGGKTTLEDLNFDYLEIVSLSGLEIDPLTGDFGSEVRLAYYHNKNKIKFFTGGSISGNIYKSLPNLRISEKLVKQDNFIGPKFIVLENVNIGKK